MLAEVYGNSLRGTVGAAVAGSEALYWYYAVCVLAFGNWLLDEYGLALLSLSEAYRSNGGGDDHVHKMEHAGKAEQAVVRETQTRPWIVNRMKRTALVGCFLR